MKTRKHRRFFTPRERIAAAGLVITFVVLAVLDITGRIG